MREKGSTYFCGTIDQGNHRAVFYFNPLIFGRRNPLAERKGKVRKRTAPSTATIRSYPSQQLELSGLPAFLWKMSTIADDFLSGARRHWPFILGGLFAGALWLRWPAPAPEWVHVDEWVFLLNPLKIWSGDLNPHFFIYPTLHIYLCSALYYLYYLIFFAEPVGSFIAYRFFVDGGDLIELARSLNTVLAAATVLVVAATGRRLYGCGGGLVAGAFFAVLPLSVRFAHLATTDSAATWWISLSILGCVRVAQQGRGRDYALAGVCAGLAGATKYPAALVCCPVALACLLHAPTLRQRGLWWASGLAAATFAATSPFVLLDVGNAWADLSEMGRVHMASPLATTDVPSAYYYIRYALRYGIGLVGVGAAVAALLWPQRKREEWVIVAAFAVFACLIFAAESVFMRYALPLAPLCALLWARLVMALRGHLALMVALVLIAEPLYASLQTRRLLSGTDTREQALQWLATHAGDGAWVVNLPPLVGNIEALYPEYVFAREKRFVHSFSSGDLLEAYAGLAARDDLPPLYAFLTPRGLRGRADATVGEAFVLWYEHPACPEVAEVGDRAFLQQCTWIEEFSPGDTERATYEPIDWYFAPIGDFSAIEHTGPLIRLGRVGLAERGGRGDARSFFAVLHDILRAKLRTADGAWAEALAMYRTIEQAPLSLPRVLNSVYLYDYLYSFGLCYSKLGMPGQAIILWERALAVKGHDAELHNNLGVAYAQVGQGVKAAERLAAAIELEPRYAEAYYNLGNVIYRQSDKEGALAAWQGAVAADPEYALAHFNLGNLHYESGAWDRAIASYGRAAGARDGRIFYNLAQAHLQKQQPQEAIKALLQAVDIDADDAESQFLLGTLYAQTGNAAAARSHLSRAASLEPGHPRVAKIKDLMESLIHDTRVK